MGLTFKNMHRIVALAFKQVNLLTPLASWGRESTAQKYLPVSNYVLDTASEFRAVSSGLQEDHHNS